MTTWGKICRICSSPADYEVFAKIPSYLHATSNEFLNWQKPIDVMLEETTGLKVNWKGILQKCSTLNKSQFNYESSFVPSDNLNSFNNFQH